MDKANSLLARPSALGGALNQGAHRIFARLF
jgi:hypothetical protein